MALLRIPYPDDGQGIFFLCLLPLSSSRSTDLSFNAAARLRALPHAVSEPDECGDGWLGLDRVL